LPIDEERRPGGRLFLLAPMAAFEDGRISAMVKDCPDIPAVGDFLEVQREWKALQRCTADRVSVEWESAGTFLDQCDDALNFIGECRTEASSSPFIPGACVKQTRFPRPDGS